MSCIELFFTSLYFLYQRSDGNVVPTEISRVETYIFKYYSSSNSYLQISTSTPHPKVTLISFASC